MTKPIILIDRRKIWTRIRFYQWFPLSVNVGQNFELGYAPGWCGNVRTLYGWEMYLLLVLAFLPQIVLEANVKWLISKQCQSMSRVFHWIMLYVGRFSGTGSGTDHRRQLLWKVVIVNYKSVWKSARGTKVLLWAHKKTTMKRSAHTQEKGSRIRRLTMASDDSGGNTWL